MSLIQGQGTKATRHDGSAVLLRRILKILNEINDKLTSYDGKGEIERMDTLIKLGKNKRKNKVTHNLSIEGNEK